MKAPGKIRMGPRKSVAASLLRTLAAEKYLAVPNPAQTAADLRLIADCILGKARWSRAGKYAPEVQAKIDFFAHMVESKAHRLPGQSVNQALDVWSAELTRQLRRSDEPDAQQELREAIAAARKAGRKGKKTGGSKN